VPQVRAAIALDKNDPAEAIEALGATLRTRGMMDKKAWLQNVTDAS
jgi:hypothetical protein